MKQKQRAISLLLVLCLLVGLFPTAAMAAESDSAAALPFTDVRSDDWFFAAVQYVYGQRLMAGTAQAAFSPDTPLSRGMFVTILGRLAGVNAEQDTQSGFSDVPNDSYCAAYAAWAAKLGMISGYGNGQFGVNDPVTREQMATIIAKYLSAKGLTLPDSASAVAGFRDADSAAAYARDGLELMRRTGILAGDDAGNFLPRNTATRAQAAVVFMRLSQAIEKLKAPTTPTGGTGSSGGSGGGTGGNQTTDSASVSSEGKVYAITGLSVSGKTVTCTVGTQEACNLTVRFLDENTGDVLDTATTDVAAGLEEDTVSATFSAVLPAHYRAEAVLTDGSGKALCNRYVCMTYTQAQENFDNLTVNDFTGESVVNFDADLADNFGVLATSVVKLDADASRNTLTAAENGVYTFENADAQLMGVKSGDAVYVDGGDGQQTLLRVAGVSVNGTTVTLTRDDSAALSDFYSVLKLDMEVAVTNEEQPQSYALRSRAAAADAQRMSAAGEEPLYAVQLFGDSSDAGGSGSKGLSVELDLSSLALDSHISAEGACSVHIQTEYDPEIFGEDYLYYEYTVENTMDAEFAIMGAVTAEMVAAFFETKPELVLFDGALPIPSVPGLEGFLTLSIPLEFKVASGLQFSAHTSDKRGVIFNAQTGAQIVNEQTASTELPYAAEFEASLSLRLYSGVQLMGGALQMGIDAKGGVELEAELNPDAGTVKPDGYHACGACLSGKRDCFASIGLTGSYNINKILYGDFLQVTAAKVTWNDEYFYISLQNDNDSLFNGLLHYGENDCPNWKYPVTIETLDNHGSPVTDVTVTVYNSAAQVVTSGPSPLTVQLYRNVNYSAKATITGAEASNAFDVTGSGAKVTLKAPQGTLKGTVTDMKTGQPIANATVTVLKDGVIYRTGKTGTDGSYAVSLPDDSWQVEISANGYETSKAADNAVSTHSGQKITLDKALERTGGTIVGFVTDSQDSAAISGAAVGVYQGGAFITSCITGTDGGYDSGKLPAGSYTVKFSAAGYGDQEKSATVTASGSVTVNAALVKGSGTLSGTVSDSAAEPQPISNAAVAVYQGDNEIGSTTTDGAGAYSLALAAGQYSIKVTKDGYAAYSESVSITGVSTTTRDVTLHPGGACGDNLYWEITGTTLRVYGTGDMYDFSQLQYGPGAVKVPWLNEKVTAVVIDSGVTSIGSYAFSSGNLFDTVSSVTLSDTVERIGTAAFWATQIAGITLPNSLKSIGDSAFANCKLSQISIPASVTEIGAYAFNATPLVTATVNGPIETVADFAFSACGLLTTVTFTDSSKLVSIGSSAFEGSRNLKTINGLDKVTTVGESAFEGCYTGLTSISLPSAVTIGASAFDSCYALASVDLPNAVTIGVGAFYWNSKLATISLPKAQTIQKGAFANCSILQTLSLPSIVNLGENSMPTEFLNLYLGKGLQTTGYSFANSLTSTVHYEGTKEQWDALSPIVSPCVSIECGYNFQP